MASELRVTTIANNAGTESVDTTYVINGSAKAWINFTMTTATNNDSLNVGSLTDNSAGNFSINTSTAFANNSYALMSGAAHNQANNTNFGDIVVVDSASSYTHIHRENSVATDTQYGSFSSAFGDLA